MVITALLIAGYLLLRSGFGWDIGAYLAVAAAALAAVPAVLPALRSRPAAGEPGVTAR